MPGNKSPVPARAAAAASFDETAARREADELLTAARVAVITEVVTGSLITTWPELAPVFP